MLHKIAMACIVCAAATAAGAAEPEVLCELGARRIYLGESVVYQVTLNHVENPSPPELVGFDDFDVTPGGSQPIDSTYITIVNGQRSEIIRRGRAYQYRLTPRRAGLLTVPAPVAQVDGRTIHGHALSLEVVAPNSQDTVVMEIAADPPSVYPTSRVTVRLSVFVRALPGELAGRNPVSIQETPPSLQIPWLDPRILPEGIKPVGDIRAWLTELREPGGAGFSINDLGETSVFSLFERRALTFQARPRRVTRKDAAGQDVEYWLYEFDREYVARRPGQFTFGPATLKGRFATGVSSDGQLTGESVYAVAPRVTVEVRDVPEAGQPASYLGAMGRFQWTAELRPTACHVGDPITLTLTLRGKGSLDAAVAPNLAEIPAVAGIFKTYEGTREVKGDACRFTYTLRPLNEAIKDFPSIPGAYFDVEADRYVTLQTEPIPVQVEKGAVLAEGQIVGPSVVARQTDEPEVRREGLYANVTDPSEFHDESIRTKYWVVGVAGLGGLYGCVALATWFVRRRMSDPAAMRRRAAAPRARRRLREATVLLKAHDVRQGAEQLRGTLVGLVADVADAAEAGMTSSDACRRLREFGVEPPVVDRLARTLDACDASRYAPVDVGMDGLAGEADELFDSVVRSLKKRRLLP